MTITVGQGYYAQQLGSTGVNANSVAGTVLDFTPGISLLTHTPTIILFKWATGTFTLAVAQLVQSALIMTPLTALANITSNVRAMAAVSNAALFDSIGTLSVNVTTINGTAATFDIEVYGFKYA